MLAINAKAALENTDLKTAAYTMKEEFKEYHNLQGLRRVIKNAEQYLADMGNTIRQNERAIITIIKLRELGYTEGDMKKLMGIVKDGRGYRKLDTELINIGGFQQPSSNLQPSGHLTRHPVAIMVMLRRTLTVHR